MTHIKRQKVISSTQVRGYNTQFLLYPRPLIDEINFCRFICVMNEGPYTCYKTEVFNIYICSFSTILYAISISDTCLSSRKSISKPNFDKISQSTAEMNYFRFRKTDGRHIGFLFPVSILTYV